MGKYLPSHSTWSRYIHRKYYIEANHHIPLSVLSRGSWKFCSYYHHLLHCHCMKSVQIRSFSGPYFSAFGLNTERYSGSLRIRSECGKIRTRKKIRSWTFFMQCAALIIRLFGLIVALPQSTKLLLLLKYSVTGNRTWWYLLSYCSLSSSFSALFCCNKFMSVSFIGTFALCWKIFLGSFLKSSLRFIA